MWVNCSRQVPVSNFETSVPAPAVHVTRVRNYIMFCAACGTQLVNFSNYCHHCGSPVANSAGIRPNISPFGAPPPPLPMAQFQSCIQCAGVGKVHRSSMPHSSGCIFCTTCPGCNGSGAIPGAACVCPKCQGAGKYHGSAMPHNDNGCIFCTDCETCQTKGWI